MKRRQGGYVLAEVLVALALLLAALALFAGMTSTALNAVQRRRDRQARLQADLESYYAEAPGAAASRTLTLAGPDFSAQIPAGEECWQGSEITIYTFRPAEDTP